MSVETTPVTLEDLMDSQDDLYYRLTRIESRIVQLMLHVGAKPHGIKETETKALRGSKNNRGS